MKKLFTLAVLIALAASFVTGTAFAQGGGVIPVTGTQNVAEFPWLIVVVGLMFLAAGWLLARRRS